MIPSHHPVPLDAGVARVVGLLDADRYECFAERAGILEFDARLPRLDAERLALIQTLARYGFPSMSEVSLLAVELGGGTQWVLSTDEPTARQRLAALGAATIETVALDDTLQQQFDDLAWLATSP